MAEVKPTAPVSIKTTKLAGVNNIHNTNLQKNLLSTSLNFNQKKRNN